MISLQPGAAPDPLELLGMVGPSGPADMWRRLSKALEDPRLDGVPNLQHDISAALANMAESSGEFARVILRLPQFLQAMVNRARFGDGPEEIFLVRHGRSERQDYFALLEQGLIKEDTAARFNVIPDAQFRLDQTGEYQGMIVGAWLESQGITSFDGAYCSRYVRGFGTAGFIARALGMKEQFQGTDLLSERNWGDYSKLSPDERREQLALLENNPRFHTPPNGESIQTVEGRVHDFLNDLYRRHSGGRVLAVSHSEFIAATRSVMERSSDNELREMLVSGMPNCGVVRYTRRDPETRKICKSFNWVAKCCPWNSKEGDGTWNGEWHAIKRPTFSADELLKMYERYPLFFPRDDGRQE